MKNTFYLLFIFLSCAQAQNPDIYFTKGKDAYNRKDYDSAIIYLSQAISLDSSNLKYFEIRWSCYDNLHKFDKSTSDIKRIIEIDSMYSPAYYYLASDKYKQKKLDESLYYINKAILLDSASAYLFHKAKILYELGDSIGSCMIIQLSIKRSLKDMQIDFNTLDSFEMNNFSYLTQFISRVNLTNRTWKIVIEDSSSMKGYLMVYHPNSQLAAKLNLINNIPYGKLYQYYNNGKLRSSVEYVNGKEDGLNVKYYKNGNVKDSIRIKSGTFDGYYMRYSETGELLEKTLYNNGKFVETWMNGIYFKEENGIYYQEENDSFDNH
jgi:antitoxin component YwqK of YwqJK toxin-antitoxin module